MHRASDYELELMKIIWTGGGTAMYADLVAGLAAKGRSWTKSTIIMLLSRLMEKGFLKSSKTGRKNIYTAIVAEHAYQAEQAAVFVNKLYDGNIKGLLVSLVEGEMLSKEDYDELKAYWTPTFPFRGG